MSPPPGARLAREQEVPLVADHVYGLRAWTVAGDVEEERLAGRFKDVEWPSREPIAARCLAVDDHAPPASMCTCGVYALHPSDDAARELYWTARGDVVHGGGGPAPSVVGIIKAWGTLEVHGGGFRAEYARPHAFVVFDAMDTTNQGRRTRRLAQSYGAELIEARDAEDLHRHCLNHDLGLGEDALGALLGAEFVRERRRRRRGETATTMANALGGVIVTLGLLVYLIAVLLHY